MANLFQHIVKLSSENRNEHSRLFAETKAGAFICSGGSALLVINNVSRVLTEGDMLLYPPYADVTLSESDTDFCGYLAIVDYEFVFLQLNPWNGVPTFISYRGIRLSDYSKKIFKP